MRGTMHRAPHINTNAQESTYPSFGKVLSKLGYVTPESAKRICVNKRKQRHGILGRPKPPRRSKPEEVS